MTGNINNTYHLQSVRSDAHQIPVQETVLIIDDNLVNRRLLAQILSPHYTVLEAENEQVALTVLREQHDEISAVVLDLAMSIVDGYAVLKEIGQNECYGNLPVVVTTDSGQHDSERMALALGAWEFITKPYDAEIIRFRLKNVIDRSQLTALKKLKYLADYDTLTGIFNKTKFFEMTRAMLDANRDTRFVFLRFDVDRFQLINSFFGTDEGDKLIIYIAQHLAEKAGKYRQATYGRIESDILALCVPYEQTQVENMVRQSKKTLVQFNPNYDIVPSVGLYVIDDPTISIEEMYNRATLAAKTCKGSYVDFFAYYNKDMSAKLENEQTITNEMSFALENGQFEIYLQPKYNIHTNLPCGAEALVRWRHPQKGLLFPNEFIPLFERNGFITKLDYYVWEQACQCLQGWQKQGYTPYPLSVNVSRVNLYNPNLVDMLLELVERYQLEPALLNLELTESAYTDNPTAMKKTMDQLQSHGFTIMMDDFGNGYSSLSLLKDIMIDVLKIDMQFLSISEFPKRGENIIASIIRMAKWLNIPVIAEGAETDKQVDFLRSVGCDYVQGYYYAQPMPTAEYEQLCITLAINMQRISDNKYAGYCYDDLFAMNEEMKHLFNNKLQAAVICEFSDNKIELIRVNEAYYALVGYDEAVIKSSNILLALEPPYRTPLLRAFHTCAQTLEQTECEYLRLRADGTPLWISSRLRYVATVGNKHIIIGELTDITMRKGIDAELQKYKSSLLTTDHETHTLLIVDDSEANRTALKEILAGQFCCLEADSSQAALKILQYQLNQIDLILLNINITMLDGSEFLQYKQKNPVLSEVPVIMINDHDNSEQQNSSFALGANDYIAKPFIPAVVIRRINNLLDSNHRFKEMVQEYNTMSAQIKTDLMTGLINRISAEEMIAQRLGKANKTCAMMMLDIDNFKKINDTCGHDYGDKVICAVADKLRLHFRKEDIIARMGGDEFAVFIENITDLAPVEKKARQLCASMAEIKIEGGKTEITCSVGIALSTRAEPTFTALYQNSDKALYNAKCRGKNIVSAYGEETPIDSLNQWRSDTENILNTFKDSIYVCDQNTYNLIYANDILCQMLGITAESCQGRKCYEVLMHRTLPCEFCSMPHMKVDKMYTRLFRTPNTNQLFLMHGENINRNGTIVHLEVAVDVTTVERGNVSWNEVADYAK